MARTIGPVTATSASWSLSSLGQLDAAQEPRKILGQCVQL